MSFLSEHNLGQTALARKPCYSDRFDRTNLSTCGALGLGWSLLVWASGYHMTSIYTYAGQADGLRGGIYRARVFARQAGALIPAQMTGWARFMR